MKKLTQLLKESQHLDYRRMNVGEDEEGQGMTKEEKRAFVEAVAAYRQLGEMISHKGNISEIHDSIKGIVENANNLTLKETGDWFDRVTVQRHMKSMNESFKVFSNTIKEVSTLQQRLESSYDEIGEVLGKYYEIKEGNEFGAERAKAIAAGDDSFEVDGKSYKVTGVDAEDKKNADEFANESMKLTSLIKRNEELTGKQKELDVDSDGDIEADDLADLRAGKKADESVNEAKFKVLASFGGYDLIEAPTEKDMIISKNGKKVGKLTKISKYLKDDIKSFINMVKSDKLGESVNEGVSSTDMDKIKGAVEAASSFMSVGSELKKLGMKYTFATEPLPIYIIQPTPNNKVAIVNKKYASKPDFVVGDIAVGIMEGKLNEEEIKWNAVENAIINFLKMNTKILDKRVQAKDTDGVKGGLKSIINGLVNAQRNLKLESVNEAANSKGYKPKNDFGARIVQAIDTNIKEANPKYLKKDGVDNAKILEYGKSFFDVVRNGIKAAFKFNYKIHSDVEFPMRRPKGNYFWFDSKEDMEKYLKKFLFDLKKLDAMIVNYQKKPTLKAQQEICDFWNFEIMVGSSQTGAMGPGIARSDRSGQSMYESVNEGVKLSLVDPNTNKFIKTLSLDRTYVEAEKEVETLNRRLSSSEKTKGLYWKVTSIGESVNEAAYTVKAENPYQFVNGAYAVLSAYLRDEELGPKGKRELQDIIKSLEYMRKYFYFKMSESVNELKKLPSGNFSIKVGYPTFAEYEKKAKVGDTILRYDKRGGMIKTFVNGSELDNNAEKYLDKVNGIIGGVVFLTKKGMKGVAQVPDYEKKDVGVLVLESIINEEKYTVIDPMGNQKGVGPKIQAISMAKRLGGEKTGHFVVANTNALKARRALEKFKGDFKNPKLKDMMMNLYYESVNERIVKEKVK